MVTFVLLTGAIGSIIGIVGIIWGFIAEFQSSTAMRLFAFGASLFIIASLAVSLHNRDLQYACSYNGYPAEIVWSNDKELLLQFYTTYEPKTNRWLVNRPTWLQSRTASAPSKEKVGQSWIVQEEVKVVDKSIKQPVLVTYTDPNKPGKPG